MGHKEKEAIVNNFVHSNLNYGPVFVFDTSVLKSPKIKLEKIMKVSNELRLLEILERKQGEILQNCLTPLRNSKVKNQDRWKFHMDFS